MPLDEGTFPAEPEMTDESDGSDAPTEDSDSFALMPTKIPEPEIPATQTADDPTGMIPADSDIVQPENQPDFAFFHPDALPKPTNAMSDHRPMEDSAARDSRHHAVSGIEWGLRRLTSEGSAPQMGNDPDSIPAKETPAAESANTVKVLPTPTTMAATPPLTDLPPPLADRGPDQGVPILPTQPGLSEQTQIGRVTLSSSSPGSAPSPAVQVAQAAANLPQGRTEIALSPPELGSVRIEIEGDHHKMRLIVHIERPDTFDLMRRHAAQLVAELQESGYQDVDLDFGRWDQQQDRQEADESAPAPSFAKLADTPAAPPLSAGPAGLVTNGLFLRI